MTTIFKEAASPITPIIPEMDRSTDRLPAAWMEIDLGQFRANWEAIRKAKPKDLRIASVIKDNAYGHGAIPLGRIAVENGVEMLAVATVDEALELRTAGLERPILILGERSPEEYELCAEHGFAACVGSTSGLSEAKKAARRRGKVFPIHLKIDTGMSRYGFRWSHADTFLPELKASTEIGLEGFMSHFAMSDELDKTFARLQLGRFNEVVTKARSYGIEPKYCHICNSGGFLDLPEAHFDMVRIGILPLGIYPSKVCRRLEGIAPIMSVKSRLSAVKQLEPGDHVGYGMRFTAPRNMRLGVIPAGYGCGYPRVRNQGHVLIRGRKVPIIGGVSMDAITVDLSELSDVQQWEPVTLLGRHGEDEITIHDIAALKNSVSYDAMVSWSARLPRRYID